MLNSKQWFWRTWVTSKHLVGWITTVTTTMLFEHLPWLCSTLVNLPAIIQLQIVSVVYKNLVWLVIMGNIMTFNFLFFIQCLGNEAWLGGRGKLGNSSDYVMSLCGSVSFSSDKASAVRHIFHTHPAERNLLTDLLSGNFLSVNWSFYWWLFLYGKIHFSVFYVNCFWFWDLKHSFWHPTKYAWKTFKSGKL